MNRNTFLILVVGVLIILILWWYSDDLGLSKQEDDSYSQGYSYGSLNPNLTGQTIAEGCTNEQAFNYSPLAIQDNGSCIFKFGCCDPQASNYDPQADSCDIPDNMMLCDFGYGVGYAPNYWNWTGGDIDPNQPEVQACQTGFETAKGRPMGVFEYISFVIAAMWGDLSPGTEAGNWMDTYCPWHPGQVNGYSAPTVPPEYLNQQG